jgi:hypothetical protein
MPSKKGHTTPSSIPPSTNSRSIAPSSAASSTGHTDSPLKSYSTGADSSAPKKGGLTFGRSSNEPYTTPKQTSSKSSTTTTSSSSSSGPPKLPGSAKDAQKKAQGVVAEAQDILSNIWNRYVDDTPQRVKLVDAFMAFLVALGVVQFAYCVVAGNYVCPPNSFSTLPTSSFCCCTFYFPSYKKSDTNSFTSLSTPSSPGSRPQSANLCSQPLYASRRTQRTRRNLAKSSATSERSRIMCSEV